MCIVNQTAIASPPTLTALRIEQVGGNGTVPIVDRILTMLPINLLTTDTHVCLFPSVLKHMARWIESKRIEGFAEVPPNGPSVSLLCMWPQ